MLPDRTEYAKAHKAKDNGADRDALRHLTAIERAALDAQTVTGSEPWDRFLTYIQSSIEKTERVREQAMDALASPNVLDDKQIRQLRMQVICAAERVAAWKAVIELPAKLMQQGEQAKSLMAKAELPQDADADK